MDDGRRDVFWCLSKLSWCYSTTRVEGMMGKVPYSLGVYPPVPVCTRSPPILSSRSAPSINDGKMVGARVSHDLRPHCQQPWLQFQAKAFYIAVLFLQLNEALHGWDDNARFINEFGPISHFLRRFMRNVINMRGFHTKRIAKLNNGLF